MIVERKKQRADWGTVTKVGTNKWRLRYWANGSDGYKRRSKTVYGTRKDAGDALAALRVEHSQDAPVPTVGQCWERWYLPDMKQRVDGGDMSAGSVKTYASSWRAHIEPRWASTPVDQVRPLAVQQWISTMRAGQSRSAVFVLRAVMEYAVRYEFIPANPLNVKYLYPSRSTIERDDSGIWTLDQLGELWGSIHGEWFEPAFILMAFGGCRVGESLGARVEDVSEIDGCAVVRIERQVVRNGTVSERLKNRWSYRSAVIPGKPGRRMLEIAAKADGWLTTDGTGAHAPQWRLARSWTALRDEIEFHPIRNLRNSWQTYMRWTLEVQPYYIEPLMGHIGEGVTGRHYDRPSATEFAAVVSRAYAAHPFDADWDI